MEAARSVKLLLVVLLVILQAAIGTVAARPMRGADKHQNGTGGAWLSGRVVTIAAAGASEAAKESASGEEKEAEGEEGAEAEEGPAVPYSAWQDVAALILGAAAIAAAYMVIKRMAERK